MTGPTFIECDRIDLVPPGEEDLDFLVAGVNHPEVRRYINVFRTPYTEERYREEFWAMDSGDDGASLLAVPREGEFAAEPVGSVQLYPLNDADGYANLGVWFHPEAWGDGYALEASAHLVEYGFDHLGLHRVSATTMAPNEAAATLCSRLGFACEGTAREAQFADGQYVDVERWGLLVDEWAGPAAVLDG